MRRCIKLLYAHSRRTVSACIVVATAAPPQEQMDKANAKQSRPFFLLDIQILYSNIALYR